MMSVWQKLMALPSVWRNMEALLAGFVLNRAAHDTLAQTNRAMQDGIALIHAMQAEVQSLNRTAEQDARLLLAYARWCEKNGCAPSSSDLMSMVQK
jgi:hypothetical protein